MENEFCSYSKEVPQTIRYKGYVLLSGSMVQLERRELLKKAGLLGTAGMTPMITGCQTLNPASGGDEADNQADGEIPSDPVNLTFINLQSGPASVFGVGGYNAAQLIVDDINSNGGILGEREIEAEYIDESAGTDQMVSQFRELANEGNVDAVMGIDSSSDALAIGPIAEDLEQLTIGLGATHEAYDDWFVENDYQYTFRTYPLATIAGVGGARYVADNLPEVETVAGINPDFAWGHSSWNMFTQALERLRPEIEIVDERFTELFSGEFTSHIQAVDETDPDLLYTSLFGGDLTSFTKQASSQNFFEGTEAFYIIGNHILQEMGSDMPEDLIVSARGPGAFNFLYEEDDLQTAFVDAYYNRFDTYPAYPAYNALREIRLYVRAVEKAYAIHGSYPNQDQIIQAMEGLTIQPAPGLPLPTPSHQMKLPALYGRTTHTDEYEFATLEDFTMYSPGRVNPPEGVASGEWIDSIQQ